MSDLVELKKISPNIILDIVYATPRNFTGKIVYSSSRCFLLRKTAERLHRVQQSLEKKGLGLKVWDGYRPKYAQQIFWDLIPNSPYVANPQVGSKHNRGTSVDLTLVDQAGNELEMPSGFDDFSERAHRDYRGASPEAIANRELLEAAMVAEGFIPYSKEWWHFDDPDWEQHPLLGVAIEDLL
jgi:D-alanyl-D-alanine dipeptidase